MTGEEEVGCEDGGEEVEVEAVEVVEEVEEVVEAEPCKYVPYKSYFGTSGCIGTSLHHGSYLGGYGHYRGLGSHYPYSHYGGLGHSYVPHVSTYVPKVCATTTVYPTTVKVEEKVEEAECVEEEVAEVKMDDQVAETLRKSK